MAIQQLHASLKYRVRGYGVYNATFNNISVILWWSFFID